MSHHASNPLPPSHPAHALLARAHSPSTAATLFQTKVQQRPLILRPTSPEPNSQDARSRRRKQRLLKKAHARRKQRPRPLSAKEKRSLGVYEMKGEEVNWGVWVGVWGLWVGYVWEVLGLRVPDEDEAGAEGKRKGRGSEDVTALAAGPKIASLDLHGADVTVVRSTCTGRVGTSGIVCRETKFTLVVVTRENQLRTIPKRGTIFRFDVPQPTTCGVDDTLEPSHPNLDSGKDRPRNLVFELHGSQIEARPADRATKKFKPRRMDHL